MTIIMVCTSVLISGTYLVRVRSKEEVTSARQWSSHRHAVYYGHTLHVHRSERLAYRFGNGRSIVGTDRQDHIHQDMIVCCARAACKIRIAIAYGQATTTVQ